MKKIWLMGGFGNVLFQILAYRVVRRNYDDIKYVDILTQSNIITKILGWTIHERLFDTLIKKDDICKINVMKAILLLSISLISQKLKIKFKKVSFYDDINKFSIPYSNNIFGYFQNKLFLENNKEELLSLGKILREIYRLNKNYIIVHYRWGDSDWAKQHSKYYVEIKKMIKYEKEIVYIATDSPKQALKFFSDCSNIKLTDAKNAMDDFRYMISAKKLYCAPSTFSWWAAHSVENKIEVIIPKFLNDNLGMYINLNQLRIIGI